MLTLMRAESAGFNAGRTTELTFTEAARDEALSNERYGEAYEKTVASSSKLFPKNINANKQTIEIQYHDKIWLF